MPWIFFLLAAGCFFIVLNAQSALLLGIALIATLALMLAGVLSLASSRINSGSRNEVHILSPEELRALRNAASTHPASGNNPDSGGTAGGSGPSANKE